MQYEVITVSGEFCAITTDRQTAEAISRAFNGFIVERKR